LPGWVTATGVSEETKLDLLNELRWRAPARVQRAAVWALARIPDQRATGLLKMIARSHATKLARIAQLELARRLPLEYPPDRIKDDASAEPADESADSGTVQTFAEYWLAFDQLSEEEQEQIGRALIERDPASQTALARHLEEADPGGRIRALRIVTLLGLAERFADDLYRLSYDQNREVRGTAVRGLGQLSDGAARRILRNALHDEDARVQANAVEAVEQAGIGDAARDLLGKLTSPDNRVRANAVRALLRLGVREAAETLLRMLSDGNRAQRISALWLIDHMGLVTLAERITFMAACDRDVQVRLRAGALAGRMRAECAYGYDRSADTSGTTETNPEQVRP
jgi:HEAT repeat protein